MIRLLLILSSRSVHDGMSAVIGSLRLSQNCSGRLGQVGP
jgi:hypothetical protein